MQILVQEVRGLMRKDEVEEGCAEQDRGQLVAAATARVEASGDFGMDQAVVVEDLLELQSDELADGQ